jgi:hypothetical protein
MADTVSKFQKLVNNRFLFRLYLLKSVPLAFIAGIKVKKLDNNQSVTLVKYKWITQNPFRSMYFACLAMAAEMSTGLVVLNEIFQSTPPVSMLITGNQASYHKKAVGKITFTCSDGRAVSEIITKTKQTGEAYVIDLHATGIDEMGDKVAEFTFTWSVKLKTNKN